ncbi:putative development/cell death domain, kelch-type beta propeller containing protein [Tanacetum coccineum]|uniref:Development/cell death domain, kelch-type beta propeller containing protein n=1 Tax=Tanacetum coccineum TaxID=301880 RepID=A0ABQ4XSQ9_9ASTR
MQERLDLNKTQVSKHLKEVNRTIEDVPYASAVGSIMYAVRCTRPDVAFAQNMTSRFQQNPAQNLRVECYCDDGIRADRDDTKSRKDCFRFEMEAQWIGSSKQSTTAMSATESEYIAASEAAMEAVWIRKFISGLGIVPTINEPLNMYCDNSAAVHYALMNDNNLADPFTKALSNRKLTQHARSMGLRPANALFQRFSLAAAELNGALYAVGGYDGKNYLKSAERFDPREHSWTKIESMNTMRGCPCLVVLNEKLYVLGGFDGNTMIPSVEIYDPRRGSWVMGEPMNHPRGFSAAAVVKESIYIFGGLKSGEEINDTVECFMEAQGWETTEAKAGGQRCFFSAVSL